MIITIEISYYPLVEDFNLLVNTFIKKIYTPDIKVETGKMSTIITGEYSEVMDLQTNAMGDLMEKYPSVFNLKISNSCIV